MSDSAVFEWDDFATVRVQRLDGGAIAVSVDTDGLTIAMATVTKGFVVLKPYKPVEGKRGALSTGNLDYLYCGDTSVRMEGL